MKQLWPLWAKPKPSLVRDRIHNINLAFAGLMLLCAIVVAPRNAAAQQPISPDEGLPFVGWQDADRVVGSVAVVSGKIANVGSFGRVTFLNFHASERDVFKAVIFRENLGRFSRPIQELYEGKLVSIRGFVSLYKDVPQIEVRSMEQIRIVDRLPTSKIFVRPQRATGNQIRVATFNVRNLFDNVDDPYYQDDGTPAKPRSELDRIASTIRRIDADVLALQEVESRGYLQRFCDVLLREQGYEVVHYAGNDVRGSGLAVLSRLPIGSVTSHRHRTFSDSMQKVRRFSRDCLCVEVRPKRAKPFEAWVTHLKSKRGGAEATEPQRTAEAREIRRLLDEKMRRQPDARILVLGDFNDTKDSRPIAAILGSGRTALTAPHETLPRTTVTYNQEPYLEMIDFIFLSPGIARNYVAGSYQVHSATLPQSGSDHNPVSADFRF